MVTQCPITSGHSFVYDFTPDQTGSFWYEINLYRANSYLLDDDQVSFTFRAPVLSVILSSLE
jgi:hypothetical protein